MNSSLKCFCVVAETLNITEGAKQLFLTQQCVSGHIKRLEAQYGTQFFQRKPRLALTDAGKALLRTVKEISVLESGLEAEIHAIAGGRRGTLRFGIHSARSRIVMPDVLTAFAPSFPDVELDIVHGETKQLEQMLLDGNIDMFFGVNAERNSDCHYRHLMDEPIYLVVSDDILTEHLGPGYHASESALGEEADLSDFLSVPFIFTHSVSKTQQIISTFLVLNNIKLHHAVTVPDHGLQVSLCADGLCACICPRMFWGDIAAGRLASLFGHRINAFPIKGLRQRNRLELITHKQAFQPQYALAFCDIFADTLEKYMG